MFDMDLVVTRKREESETDEVALCDVRGMQLRGDPALHLLHFISCLGGISVACSVLVCEMKSGESVWSRELR